MRIDDQKAFDKVVEENIELKKQVFNLRKKVITLIGEIGSLKDCYALGVLASFLISFIFGSIVSYSLSDSFSWNCTLGVVISVWWTSLFSYYFAFRLKFK